jgi:hypothetical protein
MNDNKEFAEISEEMQERDNNERLLREIIREVSILLNHPLVSDDFKQAVLEYAPSLQHIGFMEE